MSDELIKRLERWGEGASLSNHMLGVRSARQDCADAAAALAEAQATIARLEAALSRINDKAIMNAGEFARYVREECAALSQGEGDGAKTPDTL